jgi:hypothetical protein
MGKIVVLASNEDAEAVKTALDGAGVDYEVVEPTPSNILHIVIGMVDDGEEEPTDEEPKAEEPKEPKAPKEKKEPRTDDAAPPPEEEELPVEESLGTVTVEGEVIPAIRGTADTSVLYVHFEELGPRTTYKLNESVCSFWPNDLTTPMSRMLITTERGGSMFEVLVREGETRLVVGKDLAALF